MKLIDFLDSNPKWFDSFSLSDLQTLSLVNVVVQGIIDEEIKKSFIDLLEEKRDILLNKEME